jgi:hypothetical protein
MELRCSVAEALVQSAHDAMSRALYEVGRTIPGRRTGSAQTDAAGRAYAAIQETKRAMEGIAFDLQRAANIK